jgi:hypothetical protein
MANWAIFSTYKLLQILWRRCRYKYYGGAAAGGSSLGVLHTNISESCHEMPILLLVFDKSDNSHPSVQRTKIFGVQRSAIWTSSPKKAHH